MSMTTIELQIPPAGVSKRWRWRWRRNWREGAGDDAVRDMATAVSEACLNAMEHAHGYDPCLPVKLTFRTGPGLLEVDVADAGPPFTLPSAKPSLQNKIQGGEAARGWGLYLIKKMVNNVNVLRLPDGNLLRLTMKFF